MLNRYKFVDGNVYFFLLNTGWDNESLREAIDKQWADKKITFERHGRKLTIAKTEIIQMPVMESIIEGKWYKFEKDRCEPAVSGIHFVSYNNGATGTAYWDIADRFWEPLSHMPANIHVTWFMQLPELPTSDARNLYNA